MLLASASQLFLRVTSPDASMRKASRHTLIGLIK